MDTFGVFVLSIWATYALVEKRFFRGILGLFVMTGFFGFMWNWFLPNVFLVNNVRASWFTITWMIALLALCFDGAMMMILSFIRKNWT